MFVKTFYATLMLNFAIIRRKGSSPKTAIPNFTPQSATASETHRGTIGPLPKSGPETAAQDTSLDGSRKVRLAAKAMVKKITLSMVDPIRVETSGARHHSARRRR